MTRRWLLLTAMAAVAFFAANLALSWLLARPAHQPMEQPGPTIVVAMPTLTWDDVSPEYTPTLWSMAQQGAVGNVITRSIAPHSCSQAAWMTMSAGARATWGYPPGQTGSDGIVDPCPYAPRPQQSGAGAVFPRWPAWRQQSMARAIKADIGSMATMLNTRGQCVAAAGPMAAYGAADRSGRVARYWPSAQQADLEACPVTLVDLESTSDLALRQLLNRAPLDATIVVTGLADDKTPERLRTVIVSGPGVPQGMLRSPITRQQGLIQGTDLTGLLVQRVVKDPADVLLEGRQPFVQPETDADASIEHVYGVSKALEKEHQLVAPFFYTYVVVVLVALAVGLLLLRTRGPTGRRWFALLGAWCGAVPVSTFLIGIPPWWNAPSPGIALVGGILGIAVVLAAAALLGPWRTWVAGPAVFLASVTALTIALDVTHSSRLQLISIMGLQPVYGGRYFGMGNVASAMYASTMLFAAALLAGRWVQRGHPRLAALTVAAIGFAAIVVDGHPSWGADAGGPIAMLPALAYLALNAGGIKVTWQRIVVVGGIGLLVVGGLGYLDSLRPPQYRTHIGTFVAGFLESGQTTALQRNVMLNWQMLTSQWVNLFVPVLLALTMYALMRPTSRVGRPLARVTERVTLLGHGLAAITICWLIGFATNDSGTAIPPSGMLVIAPLVILVAAWQGRSAPKDVLRRQAARRPAETAARQDAPAGSR